MPGDNNGGNTVIEQQKEAEAPAPTEEIREEPKEANPPKEADAEEDPAAAE